MRFPLLACAVVGVLVLAPATSFAIRPKVPPPGKGKPPVKAPPKAPAPKGKLTVSSMKPRPGDPILVKVTGLAAMPRGSAGGRRLVFFPVKGGWQAIFAVPLADAPEASDAADDADEPEDRGWWDVWKNRKAAPAPVAVGEKSPGASTIKIAIHDTGGLSKTLTVRQHDFPEEAIEIDPALANPPAAQAKEIDSDNAAVIAALRNNDPPMFRGRFRSLPGKKTSTFGNWRRFNKSEHKSRHLGLDAAARKGAPIRAVQRGKVALVRSGILMGGSVVVVHGAGVASAYFHVSDFAVKAGEMVEAGQTLGKVGLTGRTTGPHIHVGIWARGGFVDPAAFFRLPISAPINPETSVAKGPRRRK